MELRYEIYSGEHTDELAQLQATAFHHNNPFTKALGLSKNDLYTEFKQALLNNQYKYTLIFYDKSQENKDIIGCFSLCDAFDFKPPNDVKDFNQVPTKGEVRKYMKFLCLNRLFKQHNITKGEVLFGTTLGINPKYMGQNLGYKMFLIVLEFGLSKGYQRSIGNSINQFSKQIGRKLSIIDSYSVDVSDMMIIEDGSKPFKGLGLSQETYLLDIAKSIDNLRILMNRMNNSKL